ncbi:MAG: DUF1062 domain-containing protein [Alphaproteobacteria bacterium]|nr:DUF1062 domain-containing protein [Alphaproteobacteria bacterium]
MTETVAVRWTIAPSAPPRPRLWCGGCGATRPFESSGKARLNANGGKLDAWLIYRCCACGGTWNRPIFRRSAVREIDPALLQALQDNDPRVVARLALDATALRRVAAAVDHAPAAVVDRRLLSGAGASPERLTIQIAAPVPVGLRLDRLLAAELGLSRAALKDLTIRGPVSIAPHGARALRRAAADGVRVDVEASRDPALAAAAGRVVAAARMGGEAG